MNDDFELWKMLFVNLMVTILPVYAFFSLMNSIAERWKDGSLSVKGLGLLRFSQGVLIVSVLVYIPTLTTVMFHSCIVPIVSFTLIWGMILMLSLPAFGIAMLIHAKSEGR